MNHADSPPRNSMLVKRRPTILVVDDDELIRRIMRRALRWCAQAWEVRIASSGDEALALVAMDGSVDVLLTDLVMPGMDGAELAAIFQREHPTTVRIAYTGAVEALRRTQGTSLFDLVLLKPASLEQIQAVIAAADLRRREAKARAAERAVGG